MIGIAVKGISNDELTCIMPSSDNLKITIALGNRNETLINSENEINQVDTLDYVESFPRTSNRQKKVPVTRKNDFLW
jgi:hypothetical protein